MSNPVDFAPPLLRIQDRPPAPLAGWLFWALVALFAAIALWAVFGRLDIVAVAEGKLVPAQYLQIVQPAEQGTVKEILVREGQAVKAGQVLVRMDPVFTDADLKAARSEYHIRNLALRRVLAQLEGKEMARAKGDPPRLFAQALAQYRANVEAYRNEVSQERSLLEKAENDLAAARATKTKLEETLPTYVDLEKAYDKLAKDGFAGQLMAADKRRERIEREQDLRAQEFVIRSNLALIAQSKHKIEQIRADYRRSLEAERIDVAAKLEKARQELAKHEHRSALLELRAPADGTVKDLATHTVGTVAAPGTILMTLVPAGGRLVAEVWVGNDDIGFVHPGQEVKLKLAPYQFQKYGMVEGTVEQVSADATEAPSPNTRSDALTGRDRPMGPLAYRTVISLGEQALEADGERFALGPGMQVGAEIHLGTRSILEYLLSPVQRAFHEAAQER
jgi:HlyD family secretion protein